MVGRKREIKAGIYVIVDGKRKEREFSYYFPPQHMTQTSYMNDIFFVHENLRFQFITEFMISVIEKKEVKTNEIK